MHAVRRGRAAPLNVALYQQINTNNFHLSFLHLSVTYIMIGCILIVKQL